MVGHGDRIVSRTKFKQSNWMQNVGKFDETPPTPRFAKHFGIYRCPTTNFSAVSWEKRLVFI